MHYTQKEKDEALKKAIKDGGFFGDNNVWNSIMVIPGDNHVYRHRVETLIINNKTVFVKKKPNGEYFLPGGSTEKDVDDIDQAVNECREEARCNVKDIKFSGISYKTYLDKSKTYMREYLVKWDAMYTDIYVAKYDGKDHNHVDDVDKDKFIESGQFYPFKDCLKFFRKEHKDALLQYINNEKEESVNESYVSNYFGNLKLLKDISMNPEITISTIDQCIDIVKKQYDKMITKSKIRKSIENGTCKDQIYPVISFKFPDEEEINVGLTFYNEFSPASASFDENDGLGNMVTISPGFFKERKEAQRYILLHEIGHIRLRHVLAKNEHKKYLAGLIGPGNNDDYRQKLVARGKSQYIEQNADLYAILNGAKMYGIISVMYNKDFDKVYDYRATNAELADRYNKVYKRYVKLRESANGEEESDKELFIKEVQNLAAKYDMNYLISTEGVLDYLYVYEQEDCVKKYKPKMCPKCKGSDIGVRIMGEPVYVCQNKDCNFVFGAVPYDNDDTNAINALKKYENADIEDITDVIIETKRSELPDDIFGTDDRRYPLDTKKHVYSAIRLFGHCDEAHRKQLAEAIFRAMKKYKIPKSAIGPKNQLNKYL